MSLFFKDKECSRAIEWDYLIADINKTTVYNPYCKSTDYYEVFKHIILSLIIGKEIILLDSDFTETELVNLTGYSSFGNFSQNIDTIDGLNINNKSELIERLKASGKDWKLTLFTSGTTGLPKKVTHDLKSITRFVRISESNETSIWGFAYNPTHMAGIQVFFQALFNGNSIVRLFGLDTNVIHQEISENKITHISATPTFYRLLLPCKSIFTSVKKITSGGEKFNESTMVQLKEYFPNAKITNVYASTEAGTIFASEDDAFTIKPDFKDLIRIENNELVLHRSLMGNTDLDIQEWYYTNDLIDIIQDEPLKFRFISRKSDMINVGGYKVNPLEVEEAILAIPEIKSVIVYSKPNSVLGNIIYCEVVCTDNNINELSIRTHLKAVIQEYKIPRMIRFVEKLSMTRTGKINRTKV